MVDRLAAEVMRGFGSVPKRGAEVGGVLIGTIRPGLPTIVRIDDFEPVACEYRRGPFVSVHQRRRRRSAGLLAAAQPSVELTAYAVGYYRSHTRDGFSLAPVDLELLDRLFPGPAQVALLDQALRHQSQCGRFLRSRARAFPETPLYGVSPCSAASCWARDPAHAAPFACRGTGGRSKGKAPRARTSIAAPEEAPIFRFAGSSLCPPLDHRTRERQVIACPRLGMAAGNRSFSAPRRGVGM